MNTERLMALRAFEKDRPLKMSWWLVSDDHRGEGYTRVKANVCATAGCHAGSAWIMAGKPLSEDPNSDLHFIGSWAADYLGLAEIERHFLFEGMTHSNWSNECSKEEALARLDYLIAFGGAPLYNSGATDNSMKPWSEWAESFAPTALQPCPDCGKSELGGPDPCRCESNEDYEAARAEHEEREARFREAEQEELEEELELAEVS